MRALVLSVGIVACAACLCSPPPECVGPEDCFGRACTDGVCAQRPDASVVVVVVSGGGGAGGGVAAGGSGGGVVIPPCELNHTGSITGTVTEPSGRLALPNVMVFIPTVGLEDFPVGPASRCPGCDDDITGKPSKSTVSTITGTFQLDDVPAGLTRLVFQTGRWRREVEVSVTECTTNALSASVTRLPRSRAEGDLPRFALVTGAADPMECLLLKLAIAPSEFTRPDAGGRVQLYVNNGQLLDGGLPPEAELLTTPDRLLQYDQVLFPCRGAEAGRNSVERAAIGRFVDLGGRFFTTHYGYTWMEGQPFSQTAAWTPNAQFGASDIVDPITSFPKGAIFGQWLKQVAGIPGRMPLVDPRYNVGSVKGSTIAWLGVPARRMGPDPQWTAQLTFTTPLDAGVGCGRVAFSDFHVSTNALQVPIIPTCVNEPCPPVPSRPPFPENCLRSSFTDQEKVLVYLLFDLATCAKNDRETPTACAVETATCSRTRGCCGDLRCLEAGEMCDGGPCRCAP
ncbi:MAG: carboxypeptidase-like regulatory domain-containing protein [Myxococcales bacterium]|nr:carboxypeptidase-like regulatory domain-containing protein [Myxococcales bacterium]